MPEAPVMPTIMRVRRPAGRAGSPMARVIVRWRRPRVPNGEGGLGKYIGVKGCVVGSAELLPQVTEGTVDDRIGLTTEFRDDVTPRSGLVADEGLHRRGELVLGKEHQVCRRIGHHRPRAVGEAVGI